MSVNRFTQEAKTFSGDINQKIICNNTTRLTKTIIYECLEAFIEGDEKDNPDMDISVPPEGLKKKLNFNGANKYIKIFKGYASRYLKIAEIFKNEELLDCERYIRALKKTFYNAIPEDLYDEEGDIASIKNGSEILDTIFKEIFNKIVSDKRYAEKVLEEELVEDFVYIFMEYGVMECQILLNPNASGETNVNSK